MKDITYLIEYLIDIKVLLDGGATITRSSLVAKGLGDAIKKATASKERMQEAETMFNDIVNLAGRLNETEE